MAPFAWVRLTDPQVLASLDAFAAKLADADKSVQASAERYVPLSQIAGEESQ